MGEVKVKVKLTNVFSDVFIGQAVLEKLDLLVDCAKKRVIPNPAHPDQSATKAQ